MKNYTQEDKERLTSLAVKILPGLLASGDYTEINSDGDPEVTRYDFGKDWEEDGFHTRYAANAVSDSIHLAIEILSAVDSECNPKP